ncbi:MAG: tyrosine-type recombinase/integrase [Bacteroides sp.]|nr:tyrosine-type recombinase/integrase [Eubacterium sp.]MCM1417390.1 tyrosine-type recombinase/integrase [Roseburia sp.]MCM1461417.1 tyrosine-type recombinase/integrase [Bacteroides sp.]
MSLYSLTMRYAAALAERECASRTVQKYTRDIKKLADYAGDRPLDKALLLRFKEAIAERYSPASVNSILAAVNGFLDFIGLGELKLRQLKIQRRVFLPEERELSVGEYKRLVAAARKSGDRLALVLQTICSTGIRVSELRFITVEAVKSGRAVVSCKGKSRLIFIPLKLRRLLGEYLKRRGIAAGSVFVTSRGNPLDRSNLWRDMKRLCKAAGVAEGKVFPHNLRHLFARTFYTNEKDLLRLADLLGHSTVNTTRIYTLESGKVHEKQINRLGLILDTT